MFSFGQPCRQCGGLDPYLARPAAVPLKATSTGRRFNRHLPRGSVICCRRGAFATYVFVGRVVGTPWTRERRTHATHPARANPRVVGSGLADRARSRTPLPRPHRRRSASGRIASLLSPRGLNVYGDAWYVANPGRRTQPRRKSAGIESKHLSYRSLVSCPEPSVWAIFRAFARRRTAG
jgi:hypothetical protein